MEEHEVDIQTLHLQTQGIMIINYRHTVDMQITATNKPKVKKTPIQTVNKTFTYKPVNTCNYSSRHTEISLDIQLLY